jgi:hypothetical protein
MEQSQRVSNLEEPLFENEASQIKESLSGQKKKQNSNSLSDHLNKDDKFNCSTDEMTSKQVERQIIGGKSKLKEYSVHSPKHNLSPKSKFYN